MSTQTRQVGSAPNAGPNPSAEQPQPQQAPAAAAAVSTITAANSPAAHQQASAIPALTGQPHAADSDDDLPPLEEVTQPAQNGVQQPRAIPAAGPSGYLEMPNEVVPSRRVQPQPQPQPASGWSYTRCQDSPDDFSQSAILDSIIAGGKDHVRRLPQDYVIPQGLLMLRRLRQETFDLQRAALDGILGSETRPAAAGVNAAQPRILAEAPIRADGSLGQATGPDGRPLPTLDDATSMRHFGVPAQALQGRTMAQMAQIANGSGPSSAANGGQQPLSQQQRETLARAGSGTARLSIRQVRELGVPVQNIAGLNEDDPCFTPETLRSLASSQQPGHMIPLPRSIEVPCFTPETLSERAANQPQPQPQPRIIAEAPIRADGSLGQATGPDGQPLPTLDDATSNRYFGMPAQALQGLNMAQMTRIAEGPRAAPATGSFANAGLQVDNNNGSSSTAGLDDLFTALRLQQQRAGNVSAPGSSPAAPAGGTQANGTAQQPRGPKIEDVD